MCAAVCSLIPQKVSIWEEEEARKLPVAVSGREQARPRHRSAGPWRLRRDPTCGARWEPPHKHRAERRAGCRPLQRATDVGDPVSARSPGHQPPPAELTREGEAVAPEGRCPFHRKWFSTRLLCKRRPAPVSRPRSPSTGREPGSIRSHTGPQTPWLTRYEWQPPLVGFQRKLYRSSGSSGS